MSLVSLPAFARGPNLVRHLVFGHTSEPEAAVEMLLARMARRLYPETLPVLASCWLKTICSRGHNRVWWGELNRAIHRSLRDKPLDERSREIVLSVRAWIERTILATGQIPAARVYLTPPFRSLTAEGLIPYVARLLNEWLPTEVAYLLTNEGESGPPDDDGIPVLSTAKALDRLLVRERLSPETLELLLVPALLSPKLVYPGDAEVLRDVVLAHLGRISAPEPAVLPATLFGAAAGTALPASYEEAIESASLVRSEEGEELHVPISAADAAAILKTDPVRIGSVIVTMDGRSWHAAALHTGERDMVVYTPGERLSIDFSGDHVKLTAPWPEAPSRWFGAVPFPGPFELFGREWRTTSWEMDRDSSRLHLTFSRVLPLSEAQQPEALRPRLRPAYVDMAWSELEHALGEAVLRNTMEPIEKMRRGELIPLGRALYGVAESVRTSWRFSGKQIETQLRAVRYHAAAAVAYDRPPWRILPASLQAALMKARLSPASIGLLAEIFHEFPPGGTMRHDAGRPPAHPPQAA